MDPSIETASSCEGVVCAQNVDGTFFFVRRRTNGSFDLCVTKSHTTPETSDEDDILTVTSKRKGDKFGPIAVLEHRRKYVFASLMDRKQVLVFCVPGKSGPLSDHDVKVDLKFSATLCALKTFRNKTTNPATGIVAAVSSSGEISLLSYSGVASHVMLRTVEGPPLDRVLLVTQWKDEDLIIVGSRGSNILFYALQIGEGESLDTVNVQISREVILPECTGSSDPDSPETELIGFDIDEDFAVGLYSDGFVHILRPAEQTKKEGEGLSRWFLSDSAQKDPSQTTLAKLRQAVRLLDRPTLDNDDHEQRRNSQPPLSASSVTTLANGYFAVSYGEYVSLWDGIYCAGHSYIRTPKHVNFLLRDSLQGCVLLASKGCVQRVRFVDEGACLSLTLGTALTRKGACDAIVVDVQHDLERAPLRSQPIIVGPTSAAAACDGRFHHFYKRVIDSEEAQEVKKIRALLSRDATPSAEAVGDIIKPYCTHNGKVRRGNQGDPENLGLSKLPSERFAAVAVARCIYELQCGRSEFLVPFIDMVGAGVVCSETVISVLGVSDSWDLGPNASPLPVSSLVDPLLSSEDYLYALEAVLNRISDLPERDVVKVLRHGAQLIERSSQESKASDSCRYERIVRCCLAYHVQQTNVRHVLKKLPFSDVLTCLRCIEKLLSAEGMSNKRETARSRATQAGKFTKGVKKKREALLYRGVEDWIDSDYEKREKRAGKDETENCAAWVSYLLDAHMATIIMDKTGQEVASRMLKLIHTRRRESETLKGMSGLISHLTRRKAVPNASDPMFKLTTHAVPTQIQLD